MKLHYDRLGPLHRLIGDRLGLFAQDFSTALRRMIPRSQPGSGHRYPFLGINTRMMALVAVPVALLLAASLLTLLKLPSREPSTVIQSDATPGPRTVGMATTPAPAGKPNQSNTPESPESTSAPVRSYPAPAAWPGPSPSEQAWNFTKAMEEYTNVVQSQPGSEQALAAQLRLGGLYLQEKNYDGTIWIIGSFVASHPDDARRSDALLLLGAAYRGKSDWQQALDTYLQYPLDTSALSGYVKFQIAGMYSRLSQPEKAQEWYKKASDDEPPLRNKIDSLEEIATASLKASDTAGAMEAYRAILDVANNSTYRANVMLRLASLQRTSGSPDQANETLRQIVQNYPASQSALLALQQIAPGTVDLRDAGIVHYLNKDYSGAVALFGSYLDGDSVSDRAAEVHYQRGLAYEQMGDVDSALTQYNALLALTPNSPYVGNASLSIGNIRFLRGDMDGALAAWHTAVDKAADPEVKGEAMFWIGKVLTDRGQMNDARTYLQGAVTYASNSYAVGRATALETNPPAVQPDPPSTPGMYDVSKLVGASESERIDLKKWIASWADPDSYLVVDGRLQSRLQDDPGFQRASRLLEIGLRDEATEDFQNLIQQLDDQPLAQVDLATYLAQHGLYGPSINAAMAVLIESPAPSIMQAPKILQRLAYPVPFADTVVAQSQENGIDPLLLLAVMRQESYFNPLATSSAGARGLAQVMPGTAGDIARSLGKPDFQTQDLYRPEVSIEFGAWYVGQQLRYYGNNMYFAVASYNAGPGNVNNWIRGGVGDIDRWAQTIPISETQNYVQRVYSYYQAYRAIYRSGGN